MSSQEEKFSKNKLRSSYFTTIVSISLVLFMLGLLGLIILNTQKLANHVKENIGISIYLKEDVKEVDIIKLQKSIDATDYAKSTEYIDKEQAAETLKEDIGEDFISFLGYNPLLATIDVHLNAQFANPDSIIWIEKDLAASPKVKEVFYQKSLVSMVNENVEKISLILLGFSVLLLLIAITLINNSIRLMIYSKRFLIRTMQLVGATKKFIRRPFIFRGIIHGIYGAFIAIGLLIAVIYGTQKEIPELFEAQDVELFAILFGLVTLLGIIITWICTFFAVRKYLRIKTEYLY